MTRPTNTTSSVNYASINENFPVAGQDNDTQVFRDNFDTIKNSLSTSKTELTDLITNTARLDDDNSFDDNKISNAVFQDTKELLFDGGALSAVLPATVVNTEINYANGSYQIYRFGSDGLVTFAGLPETNTSCGKMTIELRGDGTERTINFTTTGGSTFKKNSTFPVSLKVTSASSPVIIEVWRYSTNTIFMNYLGLFA